MVVRFAHFKMPFEDNTIILQKFKKLVFVLDVVKMSLLLLLVSGTTYRMRMSALVAGGTIAFFGFAVLIGYCYTG